MSWATLEGAIAAEPQPIAEYFRKPAVQSPVVSPSGRYLALSATDGVHDRLRLMVIDLLDITHPKVLGAFDEEDIVSPLWVNDDRLVFLALDRNKAIGDRGAGALLTIDREAKEELRLLIRSNKTDFSRASQVSSGLILPASYQLLSVLRDGSDDVIVQEYKDERHLELGQADLYRLSTKTGRTVKLTADAPQFAQEWVVDEAGRPRVTLAPSGDGSAKLFWKATPDAAWTLVREFKLFDDEGKKLEPIGVSSDGFMYAIGRVQPTDDTVALLRFDMKSVDAAPTVAAKIDGYDFSGDLVRDSKGVVKGINYLSDTRGTFWLDPKIKKIQDDVDKKLPGVVNTIDCGQCEQPTNVVVVSYSDRQPRTILVYDSVAGKFLTQVKARPWINPAQMATQKLDRLTARDGLTIPVLVTRPVGVKGPAPTVVLVHGGPNVRGLQWGWNQETQFLASRGYVVVEPEFRGSTGYGDKLFRAGWKQWGLAMQDDVADATTWAVSKGYTDPKRVCIAGASYGGYATLMGLIRFPDMYRCGVEWVGVSDIELLYTIAWSDTSDTYKTFGMPVMVGDRVKDAAQLAKTSPIRRASEIKQPLLMGYGGSDVRVPVDHGKAMRDAMKRTNDNVEYVVYPLEGHGWVHDESNADWWARVEKFLDKNLKNAP